MTSVELLDILLSMLAGSTGRGRGYWRRVLGPMFVFPTVTHPEVNWAFAPRGDDSSVLTAIAAISVVKDLHPIIDADQAS